MGVMDGGEIKLVENKVIVIRVRATGIKLQKNKVLHAISRKITTNLGDACHRHKKLQKN